MNNDTSVRLDSILEQCIPYIANIDYIKEFIQQMKAQVESYDAAEQYLEELISKEQDPSKRTDLNILKMYLERNPF